MDEIKPEKESRDIRLELAPEELATAILKASALLVDRSEIGRRYVDKIIGESLATRYNREYADTLSVTPLANDILATQGELLKEAINKDDANAASSWYVDEEKNNEISFKNVKSTVLIGPDKKTIKMMSEEEDVWRPE